MVSNEVVGGIRIILGYDSDSDYRSIEQILKEEFSELQLWVTADLSDFQKLDREKEPNLILSDCNELKQSENTFLKISLNEVPEIPVIAVSSVAKEQNAIEAVKQGAADYILAEYPARLPLTIKHLVQTGKAKEYKKDRPGLRQPFLDSVFNNSDDMLLVLDTKSTVLKFNKAFESWCINQHGLRPVTGEPIHKFIHPDTVRQLKPMMDEAFRKKHPLRA